MKKNIAFISLKAKFCKLTCKMFCDKFDMLYADFNDILQYNMLNQGVIDAVGQDYFDVEEQKNLKNIVTCENIALNIDFNVLAKQNNLQIVKDNCLIIYLMFSKTDLKKFNNATTKQHTKLLVAYDVEDKICKDFADIVVSVDDNTQNNCNEIIKNIKNYYDIR